MEKLPFQALQMSACGRLHKADRAPFPCRPPYLRRCRLPLFKKTAARPLPPKKGGTVLQGYQIILAVVILFAIIAGAVLYAEKEKTGPRRAKTNKNTGAAVRVLKTYAAANDCRVLGPVTLQHKGVTVQMDALLVGWFGVLCVRALGYNGQVYGSPRQAQWLWAAADRRENFASPLEEGAAAVRAVREALMRAGVRNPFCEAVCVFTDPKVELAVPPDSGVLKLAGLRGYLRQEKFHADRGYEVDKLCEALQPLADKQ